MRSQRLLIYLSLIIAFGLISIQFLAVELKPKVESPQITVSFSVAGYSPDMLEQQVTSKLEAAITALPKIKKVSSYTYNGYGHIIVDLNKNAKLGYVQYLIDDLIQNLELPQGVFPYVSLSKKSLDEEQPLLTYRFYGEQSSQEMGYKLNQDLIPHLNSISGVSSAELSSLGRLECRILLNMEKVSSLQLNKDYILSEIKQVFNEEAIASFQTQAEVISAVLSTNKFDLNKVKALTLEVNKDNLVHLDQIADISLQFSDVQRLAHFNGLPSITLAIYRNPTSNSLEIIDQVKRKMSGFNFAETLQFQIIQDQSVFIKNEFRSIGKRALWSALAVLLVLLLFSRSYREPLILFFSIFVSICASFILFSLFGLSINFLSLAGLALSFGVLVDNSIIFFEHFKQQSSLSIEEKRNQLVLPLIASTLTTLIVLLPFIFLTEELKEFYVPFAKAYTFSLISALIISFVFISHFYQHFIEKKVDTHQNFIGESRLKIFLRPYLEKSLNYPFYFLFIFIWILGLPVYLLSDNAWQKVGLEKYKGEINLLFGGTTGLFVNFVNKNEEWNFAEETYLAVSAQMPFGSDISETERIVKNIERNILQEYKNIRIISDFGHENAYLRVYFERKDEFLAQIIKSKLIYLASNLGGVRVAVYGFGRGFNSGGGGTASTFRLSLKGYNYEQLKHMAADVIEKLSSNSRIANAEFKSTSWNSTKEHYYNIRFIDEEIQSYGLTRKELTDQIKLWLSSENPDFILDYQHKKINLRLIFKDGVRTVQKLLESFIFKDGQQIQLLKLISLEKKETTDRIVREAQNYKAFVTFDYFGSYSNGKKYLDHFLENYSPPLSFKIDYERRIFSEEDEMSVSIVFLVAAFLIFLVCSAIFESFRIAWIILFAIPASLAGIFLIYFVSAYNFTLATRIGVVLICGLSVNNAILLTSEIVVQLKQGIYSLKGAIVNATLIRLRPILMTTLTTIIGLIPLLVTEGVSGKDIWATLSLTIIGGLSSSMILIITIFPSLNYIFLKNYHLTYLKKLQQIECVEELGIL
jgi:multidrug efflux pump subunit AcrB